MTHERINFLLADRLAHWKKCSRYAVRNLRCYSRWQGLNVYIDMEELLRD